MPRIDQILQCSWHCVFKPWPYQLTRFSWMRRRCQVVSRTGGGGRPGESKAEKIVLRFVSRPKEYLTTVVEYHHLFESVVNILGCLVDTNDCRRPIGPSGRRQVFDEFDGGRAVHACGAIIPALYCRFIHKCFGKRDAPLFPATHSSDQIASDLRVPARG